MESYRRTGAQRTDRKEAERSLGETARCGIWNQAVEGKGLILRPAVVARLKKKREEEKKRREAQEAIGDHLPDSRKIQLSFRKTKSAARGRAGERASPEEPAIGGRQKKQRMAKIGEWGRPEERRGLGKNPAHQ